MKKSFLLSCSIVTMMVLVIISVCYVGYLMATESSLEVWKPHMGYYCPNCYEHYVLRQDCVHKCKKCGHEFYLYYEELPDSIKVQK